MLSKNNADLQQAERDRIAKDADVQARLLKAAQVRLLCCLNFGGEFYCTGFGGIRRESGGTGGAIARVVV